MGTVLAHFNERVEAARATGGWDWSVARVLDVIKGAPWRDPHRVFRSYGSTWCSFAFAFVRSRYCPVSPVPACAHLRHVALERMLLARICVQCLEATRCGVLRVFLCGGRSAHLPHW